MLSLSNDASTAVEAEGDDLCSLTRLIGDPDGAKETVKKLRALMKKIEKEDSDSEIGVFKAAADPCRIRILKLLKEGELCVCEIMTALNRPQSTTSHHLSILREAGLIRERRAGKWLHYRLSDGAVIELLNQAKLLKDK
ncbi:MAG: metalloregulator ArsR/SmtB family transcription factor [Methanotrichaceae archaeon]|nr:metalloregulator ArsR/SmtB family transcription factor [Methanotrichaceae archaeon]